MPRRDLTPEEQGYVRTCLQMLRARFGNWRGVDRALPISHGALNYLLGTCRFTMC